MSFEVDVQRASGSDGVPGDDALTAWAREVLARHLASAAMSLRIVDEEEGVVLNRSYRHGEHATNVLSFPFQAGSLTEPPLLGDVVICAAVVEREANEQGKSVTSHYAHMVVHGVLHLLGHDHRTDEEANTMEELERSALRSLGFADPYAGERSE